MGKFISVQKVDARDIDTSALDTTEITSKLSSGKFIITDKRRYNSNVARSTVYNSTPKTTKTPASTVLSDKITEGEFNRSAAMQNRYGTYTNYINGVVREISEKASEGEFNRSMSMQNKYGTYSNYLDGVVDWQFSDEQLASDDYGKELNEQLTALLRQRSDVSSRESSFFSEVAEDAKKQAKVIEESIDDIKSQRQAWSKKKDLYKQQAIADEIKSNESYDTYASAGEQMQGGIVKPENLNYTERLKRIESVMAEQQEVQASQDPAVIAQYEEQLNRQLEELELIFWTDEEVSIYNAILARDGAVAAEEYRKLIQPQVNARYNAAMLQTEKEDAKEDKFTGVITNLVSGWAGATAYGKILYTQLKNQFTGSADNVDINSNAFNAVAMQGASQEGLTDGLSFWGKLFVEAGLSGTASLSRMLMLGPLSMAVMASSAAGQSAYETLKKGGTVDDAVATGAISGFAEWITEKVSVESLFDLLDFKDYKSAGRLLLNLGKILASEGSQEMASDYINLAADIMTFGNNSDYMKAVRAYEIEGYTEQDARKKAFLVHAVVNPLISGVTGAVSGLMLGGGGVLGSALDMVNSPRYFTENDISSFTRMESKREELVKKAGDNKKKVRAINQEYDNIKEAQIAAIVKAAGEQDMEAAAKEVVGDIEQRAAKATSETERTGILSGASTTQIQTAVNIGRALSREIRFYSSDAEGDNGYYEDGVIWLNALGSDPIEQTISHELTHNIEASELYESMRDMVFSRMTESELNTTRAEVEKLYNERHGQNLDAEGIDREVFAKWVQKNLLTNEKQIYSLVQESPTIGQQILELIDAILAKLGVNSAKERQFLQKTRNIYAQALGQTATVQQREDEYIARLRGRLARGEISEEEFDEAYDAYAQNNPYIRERESKGISEDLKRHSFSEEGKNGGKEEIELNRTGTRNSPNIERASRGSAADVTGGESGVRGARQTDRGVPLAGEYEERVQGRSEQRSTLGGRLDLGKVEGRLELERVTPAPGSVAEYITNKAQAEYGIPVITVKDEVWESEFGKTAPAANTIGTTIYTKENTPERVKETTVPHEATHVMQHKAYPAYVAFYDNVYEALNMGSPSTVHMMQKVLDHAGLTFEDLSAADESAEAQMKAAKNLYKFYSELVATVYGEAASGVTSGETRDGVYIDFYEAFNDFDSFFSELSAIHEQFKKDNKAEMQHSYVSPTKITDKRQKALVLAQLRKYTEGEIEFAELRGFINGIDSANSIQMETQDETQDEAKRIVEQAHSIGMTATEYVRANWDEYDYNGRPNEAARMAMRMDSRQYSFIGYTADGTEVYETNADVKAISWAKRKSLFLRIMQNEYRGRTAKFVRNGHAYYATFTEDDVRKNIYGDDKSDNAGRDAKINIGASGDIFELVEHSVYDGSMSEKGKTTKAHKGVGYWDYFVKKVQIDNKVFDLLANVRKKQDGEYVYNLRLNEDKKIKAAPPRIPENQGFQNGAQTASSGIVSQGAGNVNTPDYGDRQYSFTEEAEEYRGKLNQKAKNYLARTEKSLLNRVAGVLSVPKTVQRNYLSEEVKAIVDEYLIKDEISRETIDSAFERAYAQGVVMDTEFYDTYRDVKDRIREMRLNVTEQEKADFTDWADYRRRAWGTTNVVNSGGIYVDVAYEELRRMAPALFPEIDVPSDQLRQIVDVAKSIQKVERGLDDAYGREFKAWAKRDFEVAVDDTMSDLRRVKRYQDDRAAKKDETAPLTQEELKQVWQDVKAARRNADKVMARYLLTEHDKSVVGMLLRGEMSLGQVEGENAEAIKKVYEAKQEYEELCKIISRYNRARKTSLYKEADELLTKLPYFKDKKMGFLYERETMERNIRDIAPDKETADALIQKYITPIKTENANSNRLKNKFRDRVRQLNLSTKTKRGDMESEAYAVQFIGEAQDNINYLEKSGQKTRDGKTEKEWLAVIDQFWKENPGIDQKKVNDAIKEFREIYDQLFDAMNATRLRNGYEPVNYRKGYFPHFQDNEGGILGKFGRALGISMDVTQLPTTINGLTHAFKPGIQWFGHAQSRTGYSTAYDALQGFDKYIEGIADVICMTDNIQRLRALEHQIRYKASDDGIREQIDSVDKMNLSEEEKSSLKDEIYSKAKFNLSNFANNLQEYTNILANKKSVGDRAMEYSIGRRMYNIMRTVESRVGANMVGANIGSALTNFVPLAQGWSVIGSRDIIRGMFETLKGIKQTDDIHDMSDFLINRRGSDPLVRTGIEKVTDKLGIIMELVDQFTSETIVRAKYHQNMRRGMSEAEALTDADNFAAGLIADRSKGAQPTLFNRKSPLVKAFTQFQLEVNNQLGFLFKDLPREQREKGKMAIVLALLKFFVGQWIFNEIYEYFIGRRPALDVIDMLNETVGDFTGYKLPNAVDAIADYIAGENVDFKTDKKSASGAVTNLLIDTIGEEVPFLGNVLGGGRIPVTSVLPDVELLIETLLSDKIEEKKWAVVKDELVFSLALNTVLPAAGGQVKKIVQGIETIKKGGYYSVDAEGNQLLKYPFYTDEGGDTYWNAYKTIVFGRSATETAQKWVEEEFNSMSARQTAAYQAMVEAGSAQRYAYEFVEEFRNLKKTDTQTENEVKLDYIMSSNQSDASKAMAYYYLMLGNGDEQRAIIDQYGAGAAIALMEIKDAGYTYEGTEKSNEIRSDIINSGLTDDAKETLYYKYISSEEYRQDDIEAFKKVGLGIDDFMIAQTEYANNSDDDKATSALAFSSWVETAGYSDKQKEVIRDVFKYYQQVPVIAERYESLIDAGLSDVQAYSLTEQLNELEPLPGKTNVSNAQKYEVVANSDLSVDDQLAVLKTMMENDEYMTWYVGSRYGVEPKVYAEYLMARSNYDEDGNGSYTQDEKTAAIKAMGLDTKTSAALWQMAVQKTTKATNNPFDKQIGWAVYTERQDNALILK